MKRSFCHLLIAAVLLLCPSANAALMDFESLSPSPSPPPSLPYTEDGISMDTSTATPLGIFEKPDGHNVAHFDGGTILFDMLGSTFNLTAIDFDFVGIPATALEVTTNGFTVTLPKTFGQLGTIFFDTYPQFSSITSFSVYDPTGWACYEFDWIGTNGDLGPVNVIPEPSTLLLLGTGLFGLAGIARRRKD